MLLCYTMMLATVTNLHPYLSCALLWVHENQLKKTYVSLLTAESTCELLQNASMVEVEGGCIICSKPKQRFVSDFVLEEDADYVLMTPAETLLALLPSRILLPYASVPRKAAQKTLIGLLDSHQSPGKSV